MSCLPGTSQGSHCFGHVHPGTDLGPTQKKNLQKHSNAEILLQSCELVLNIYSSQSLVDRMQNLLALESTASTI